MRKNWETYWFFSSYRSITPKGINEEGNVCNNGQIGILVAITTPCLCSLMLFLMSLFIKRDCCVVGTKLMWQNIAAFQFNVFITHSWRKCAFFLLMKICSTKMNKLSKLIKGKWLSYLKEGSTFRWYHTWENAILKRSNHTVKLEHAPLSKSCVHQVRKIMRCWSPLHNAQLNMLDSVLCNILPCGPDQRKKPLSSCNSCLNFWEPTQHPAA